LVLDREHDIAIFVFLQKGFFRHPKYNGARFKYLPEILTTYSMVWFHIKPFDIFARSMR